MISIDSNACLINLGTILKKNYNIIICMEIIQRVIIVVPIV